MSRAHLRFGTKLALVAGVSVFVGLGASLVLALLAFARLGEEASRITRDGLRSVSHEYVSHALDDTARQTHLLFERTFGELTIASDAVQRFMDRDADLRRFADAPATPELEARGPTMRQTRAGGDCVVVVWTYELGADGTLQGGLRARLARDALLEPILSATQHGGVPKVQTYLVTPDDESLLRLCPWKDLAGEMARLYPDIVARIDAPAHAFWASFFPGIAEGWKGWLAGGALPARPDQMTLTAPYEDAGGGGAIITLFLPLWSPDRRRFDGAVGMDVSLGDITAYIESVRLGRSGFAFLAQQNGNVLAIKPAGEQTLHLRSGAAGAGVSILDRPLAGSSATEVASVRLPGDEAVHFTEIWIDGEPYAVALKRLPAFAHVWSGSSDLPAESWTLGFVVPMNELEAPVAAARTAIGRRIRSVVFGQVLSAGVTLVLVLLGMAVVSGRMTRTVRALASGAARIMRKDYDVEISTASHDEMAQLGTAFNAMVQEIREHTRALERRVAERTLQLKDANAQISLLNDKLKAENHRLGSELDAARQVQTMMLPHGRELREIQELDVVGHMQPATEIGGDYYDVVRLPYGISIGIGDVTGHGLQSGVLMLMIQTAVRTLLATDERDVTRILAVVNRVLFQNVQRINIDHSATLSLLLYHEGSLTLTGQHEDVIVVRKDGATELVSTMNLGFPVGIEFDISAFVDKATIQLEPGEIVVLYTDGITEAENVTREQYGLDRLCAVVARHRAGEAQTIKDAVLSDVMAFIGEQHVFDDITLIVAKRN